MSSATIVDNVIQPSSHDKVRRSSGEHPLLLAAAKPEPPESHHEKPKESAPRLPSLLRLATLTVLVIATFVALSVFGLRARARQQWDRAASVATAAGRSDRPRVLTTKAERAPAKVEQILPGSAAPFLETAVYARTSGYLKRWLVDIGDKVKEGQLLAEIETPEVDAQLLQIRATLAESRATLVRNRASEYLAKVNLGRIKELIDKGAGSRQEFDEADAAHQVAVATVHVSEATIQANEANVHRLEDIQKFQKVTAPFNGVITARNYDTGALIVADNATARELFHITQIRTLRVFADVPQTFATAVHPGQIAPVFRREVPGREFAGKVTRTTNAVDPVTRTLRVEVEVPNTDFALLPGMYLQVRFQFDNPTSIVRVPGAAVITRAEGAKVAIVDAQGTIRYRTVQVGRDFGSIIEVTGGLAGGETIVVRPGDDLAEGTPVEAVAGGST